MSKKIQKHRFILLFMLLFMLNSCGGMYSCNYPPTAKTVDNQDPCTNDSNAYKWGFKSITPGIDGHSLDITLVIKGPCSSSDAPTFALSFYDPVNPEVPSDLISTQFPKSWTDPSFSISSKSCDPSSENPTDSELNDGSTAANDIKTLIAGNSITFGIGQSTKNKLFPYYIKAPNTNGVGQGKGACFYTDNSGSNIVDTTKFSPFAIDATTLSPVYDTTKNQYASVSANYATEVPLAAANPYKIASISAPFYTYGMKPINDGILSSRTNLDSLEGSIYHFKVYFDNKYSFLAVLSYVSNPAKGMSGDFSLTGPKIYSSTANSQDNSFFDKRYTEDCNKQVSSSCGTTVTTS